MRLGRGGGDGEGSTLTIHGATIVKTAPVGESIFMQRHPTVFVPVLWADRVSGTTARYAMPRLNASTPAHLEEALLEGLDRLTHLWACPHYVKTSAQSDWRPLLVEHVRRRVKDHALEIDLSVAESVISRLPNVKHHVEIHGDATLANLVHGPALGWRWIDPLQRVFIPGDPHVDLGKALQSCLGYEQVLLGQSRSPRVDVASRLAARHSLDEMTGWLWCYVHMIRLLSYQTMQDRKVFMAMLQEVSQQIERTT